MSLKNSKFIPLDGGYGWVIVFGSFLSHIIIDGFIYSFGMLDFNVTEFQSAVILAFLAGIMLLIGPVASKLCDKIGYRLVMIIGAIISVIGCLLCLITKTVMQKIIAVGILPGIGCGLMYCSGIIIVTIYFEKKRSLATGITVCGTGVGTIIFAFLIPSLNKLVSPDYIIPIYGGILFICVPIGLLYRPLEIQSINSNNNLFNFKQNKNNLYKINKSINQGSIDSINFKKASKCTEFIKRIIDSFDLGLIIDPVYGLFLLSNFFTCLAYNGPSYFMPFIAKQYFLLNKNTESLSICFYGIGTIIGRILFGFLCDLKFSFKWGQNVKNNRLFIYCTALIVCGLSSSLILIIIKSQILFFMYCFFFGFTISSFIFLSSVIIVDLINVNRLVNGFGISLFVQGISTLFGTPIGAYLKDRTLNYNLTFMFFGISFTLGGLLIIPIFFIAKSKN